MKKLVLSISMFLIAATTFAQSEVVTDSIPPISLDGYKNFNGFMLDMGSMIMAPPPLIAPQLYYQPYNNNTIANYNEIFRPNMNIIYDRGSYNHVFTPMYPGMGIYGFGTMSMPPTLQSATFKLKNGLYITTYGEYDADGNKVRNPSALPWERNNFNGAFEMKSENRSTKRKKQSFLNYKLKDRKMKSSHAKQNLCTAAFLFIFNSITTFSNSGSSCSTLH